MPWSGGVYTRGYPSWTADANNNLPISATKFDTEDNDFAAGLNNCLTIDGLNKPTATLSWSQQIALTRGTDGNLLSIARTGGSTNPSLTWSVTDSGDHVRAALNTGNFALDFTPSGYSFGNSTDDPTFSFLGTGKGTVTGGWTFSGDTSVPNVGVAGVVIGTINGGVIPVTQYVNSSQSANNRVWRSYVNGLQYIIDIDDDANTSTKPGLTLIRSTTSLTEVDLGNITDNSIVKCSAAGALREVGFRSGESNVQNTPYTLAQTDNGRIVESGATAGGTITVPVLAQGTLITYINGTSGTITLTGSSVTLRLGNSPGTTGNRTLAQWAAATIYYTATNVAYVFGGGVT